MDRILRTNGTGEQTYFPPAMVKLSFTLADAREEAEMVLFGCMDKLLQSTGIKPQQIDILITNCSLFCPTPSLSAMVKPALSLRYALRS